MSSSSTEVTSRVGIQDAAIPAALLMCVLGAVFYCYEYYLRVAPSVIQPQLMEIFSVSQAGLGTLIAYYYLAYVPLQIPVGLMIDFWGPRRVLTLACVFCAAGTYVFANTESILVAKLGRFMVGFGSAFAYVGVLKIANLWLPHKYFAMVAGFCTALGMFGAMSGGILMAKFINLAGWQQAMCISAVVGVILSVILWSIIRDNSDREVMQLSRAAHKGLSLWSELLEVIKTKQLWINGCIGCLMFLPLTAFAEFWSVSYLEKIGLSKESAVFGSSMVFLGFAVGGPLWGYTSDMIKSRRIPLMLGSVSSAVIAFVILTTTSQNLQYLNMLLFTLGALASAQVLVFAVGEDSCRPGMTATTVSFTNFLVMLGGWVLQPVVGHSLDALEKLNMHSIVSFKIALLVMPLGLLLGSILSFFLKESYALKS